MWGSNPKGNIQGSIGMVTYRLIPQMSGLQFCNYGFDDDLFVSGNVIIVIKIKSYYLSFILLGVLGNKMTFNTVL